MENNVEDVPLYDPQLLLDLNFSEVTKVSFNPPVSPSNPGDSLVMRPLCISDYDRGFLQLLTQLTKVGSISRKLFIEQFNALKACRDSYYITVILDTNTNQIVASATLGIDLKFIHQCGKKGKIDEVVVREEYRGRQLGKLLVETMTLLSQHLGCYKTTLECKTENIPFYNKFNFVKDAENYMTYRHEHAAKHREEES